MHGYVATVLLLEKTCCLFSCLLLVVSDVDLFSVDHAQWPGKLAAVVLDIAPQRCWRNIAIAEAV